MSGEIWRSEVVAFGFMMLNMAAVTVGLVWAWRRGMFKDLETTMHTALELPPETASSKENCNG